MNKQNRDNSDAAKTRAKYILVAEDDSYYGQIYAYKLAREGYEVKVVDNGQKALAEIARRKPDLLILDLLMPVMDGFEVMERLKKDKKNKNITVIAISNLSYREDTGEFRHMGITDYIEKANMSINDVVNKIRQYLK